MKYTIYYKDAINEIHKIKTFDKLQEASKYIEKVFTSKAVSWKFAIIGEHEKWKYDYFKKM